MGLPSPRLKYSILESASSTMPVSTVCAWQPLRYRQCQPGEEQCEHSQVFCRVHVRTLPCRVRGHDFSTASGRHCTSSISLGRHSLVKNGSSGL